MTQFVESFTFQRFLESSSLAACVLISFRAFLKIMYCNTRADFLGKEWWLVDSDRVLVLRPSGAAISLFRS